MSRAVVLTMMSDLATHNIELQTSHARYVPWFPVNPTQSHFRHDGLCFVWSKVAFPADVTPGCACGRLMDDLQTPAQAKILMVYEEDLLAQTSRPVSPA